MAGQTEILELIYEFGNKLPIAPERFTYYSGLFSIVHGAVATELANPIMGGIEVIVGTVAICAAVSSVPTETVGQQG